MLQSWSAAGDAVINVHKPRCGFKEVQCMSFCATDERRSKFITGLLRQDGNSHGTDEVLAMLLKYGISAKEELLEIQRWTRFSISTLKELMHQELWIRKPPFGFRKKPLKVRENAAVINGGCQGKIEIGMQDVKIHVFPKNLNCHPVQVDAAHYYSLSFWSDIMFKKNKNKQNVSVLLYSNVTVRSQSARSFGMFFFRFLFFWFLLLLRLSAWAGISSPGIIARICPCWSNSGLRPCVWCSVHQSPRSRTRCSPRPPPRPLWGQTKAPFTHPRKWGYLSICTFFAWWGLGMLHMGIYRIVFIDLYLKDFGCFVCFNPKIIPL